MTEKPLAWLGSSLDDVRMFPAEARRAAGYQLGRVQQGLMPDDWKPMTTVVYVIHAFEKRTPQTREADIALARKRLADFLRFRGQKKEAR